MGVLMIVQATHLGSLTGRAFGSFNTSLSFQIVSATRTSVFVMMLLVCMFEVKGVIGLHCANMRSSSSVFRSRGGIQ